MQESARALIVGENGDTYATMPKSTHTYASKTESEVSDLAVNVDKLTNVIERLGGILSTAAHPGESKALSGASVKITYEDPGTDESGSEDGSEGEAKAVISRKFTHTISLKDMIRTAGTCTKDSASKFLKSRGITNRNDFLASIVVSILSGAAYAYERMNEFEDKVDTTFASKSWKWAVAKIMSAITNEYKNTDPLPDLSHTSGVAMWMVQYMNADGIMPVDEDSIRDLNTHNELAVVQNMVKRVFKAMNKIVDRTVFPYPIATFVECFERGKYFDTNGSDYAFLVPAKIRRPNKVEVVASGAHKKIYAAMAKYALADKHASMNDNLRRYLTDVQPDYTALSTYLDDIESKRKSGSKRTNKIKAEYEMA